MKNLESSKILEKLKNLDLVRLENLKDWMFGKLEKFRKFEKQKIQKLKNFDNLVGFETLDNFLWRYVDVNNRTQYRVHFNYDIFIVVIQ